MMDDQPVIRFESGINVYFDAWSGGASQAGLLGQITLRFGRNPDEPGTRRRYLALDAKPVTYDEMRPFDGKMVKHAIRELALLPKDEGGEDDDGLTKLMYDNIINCVRMFASAGYSGGFAPMAIATLTKLLEQQPLTPLTGSDDEWETDLPEDCNPDPQRRIVAQNKRCSRVMRRADGTCFDVERYVFRDQRGDLFTNGKSHVDVTFPYEPMQNILPRVRD